MEEQRESYYDWIVAHDLLELLRPLWEQGGWNLREDGKLYAKETHMAIETPWRHIKQAWWMDCHTWHRLILDHIVKKLPQEEKFVPSGCLNCFKVVVRPQTVKQLFALEELEKKLDRPSKCGIEVRSSVHGLYGGYFYCRGLEEGLERYKQVRKAVNEDKHMGPDVPVILKRACTEFELEIGPSDKWQMSDLGRKFEELVDRWVAKNDRAYTQPDIQIWHIHRKWLEFAWANGDKTVLEFTHNKPLYAPYVVYHNLADQPQLPSDPQGFGSNDLEVTDDEYEGKVA